GAAEQQPYPAPGDQGSRYGTTAYDPGAVGQEMAEPKGWARLKTLTLVSLVIYVLTQVVGFLLSGSEAYMDAQLDAQSGLGIPREQLEETVQMSMAFAMVVSVVVLVIAVGLYLLVFFGLKRGKNWARVLGTVLASVGTLFTLGSLIGVGLMMSAAPGLGVATLVVTLALAAVNIWWIVTAFSPDVNAYMRARSGR
ncbi:MAG: hypothetical protein MOP51_867, partial [Citricoccus sp.]|nr:hypothetical protein [Citricoccus sp. WCRC_4]